MLKRFGPLFCLLACFATAQSPSAEPGHAQPAQSGSSNSTAQPSVGAGHAQSGTFQAGSEEVLLDIVARDKKGHPVTDLTANDIAVYDNGTKRAITSFRLIQGKEAFVASAQGGAAPAKEQLDPLRQIRLITLIFSRLDSVEDRMLARNAALDLTKAELPQNVFMSVLVSDQRLKALQAFTNDLDSLRQAIKEATGGGYTQFDADSQRIQQQLQNVVGPATAGESAEQQAMGGATPGNSGPGAAASAANGANIAMAQMLLNMLQLERTAVAVQSGRAAITGLLDAVKEQYRLPGRKSIFLFSDGFTVPQGMEEAFRTVISAANRFNVSFYTIDARGLGTSALNDASTSELRGATAASRAQFSRPSQITPQMAKEEDTAIESGRANTQNYLAELANSTGGFLMANQNDFRSSMRKAVEDIETYYELTYNPGIQKYDGSFRRIDVKTDRPGIKLYSRAGYFALPRSIGGKGEVLAPYELPLLNAINAKPVPRDFEVHSAALHFRNGKESICEIVLDMPMSDFSFQKADKRYQAEFAYVVLIKNQAGEVIRNFRSDVPLNPQETQVEALKQSHFIYTQNFPLPPGRYVLDASVMDRKSEKFSVRKSSFFIPPLSSPLGISSIAIVRSVQNRDREIADPLAMGDKVITPTLSPIDRKQNGLSLFTTIYPDPASTAHPELAIQISKDGSVIGGGTPQLGQPDAQGRVQYVATIPLDKLAPGNYEVRFLVKQGTEQAAEATAFTLE